MVKILSPAIIHSLHTHVQPKIVWLCSRLNCSTSILMATVWIST